MNFIMQQLINQKINSISKEEFLQLAEKQGYPLTSQQADSVLRILRQQTINVGNKKQVEAIINQLTNETDSYVSSTVSQLFQKYNHML
ncbi:MULTISPECIES: DUF2624 family protein [Shouchella]|uniref:DUF2624 family protein n=2 Tax=Shouchella TaxID=2893057 RepID=A0ABY7W3Q2_9BACI|nr:MULTISPECIES: DUF2624 family protein [Shouchella]MED4127906.1 DUF2624 family protein [Shouchella miscanthi]WDF03054.1 DUF2624 family protein [Shouchella hunanensis]